MWANWSGHFTCTSQQTGKTGPVGPAEAPTTGPLGPAEAPTTGPVGPEEAPATGKLGPAEAPATGKLGGQTSTSVCYVMLQVALLGLGSKSLPILLYILCYVAGGQSES